MASPMRVFLVALFLSSCLFAQDLAVQKSNTTENLRGISTPSRNVAWASGTHGTYLRTTDGGETWQAAQVPGAETLDFRDVEAFSADVAYLLAAGPGEQSRIYKTADAGKTWALQFTNNNPKGFFDCMAFWNRDRGIAVGDPVNGKFELITTKDGGKHWKSIPTASLPSAVESEGAFAASGTCIAVHDAAVRRGVAGAGVGILHLGHVVMKPAAGSAPQCRHTHRPRRGFERHLLYRLPRLKKRSDRRRRLQAARKRRP
ncbi:MAG: hypothetical protein LAO09_02165 [Acidobacteriia bacterium]|nr:hypothetical protein [Terriglobia bacterium]